MLAGFYLIFGLGSLLASACSAKPLPPKADPEKTALDNYLKDCDEESRKTNNRLTISVPDDYLETLTDIDPILMKYRIGPLSWFEVAATREQTIAEARCDYFRWRCEKDGIPFDYGTVMRYCNSFGSTVRKTCFWPK